MSGKKQSRGVRVLQSVLGYALTLMFVLSLTGACALALTERLLTDHALHERVALDDRVLSAQMAAVEQTVQELAEKYSFAPETVMNLVTRENLADYGREMVAWWMGLLGEEPMAEAPFPDTLAMEGAVREDELFREHTEDFMRRTIARDDIAYPVGKAMQEAVMPIRVSLVSLSMPTVTERVNLPALLKLLGAAKLSLFALAVALMALLLVQGRKRFLFASAGLLASFVLLAGVTAATMLAKLPLALGEYSSLLSLQLGVLGGALLPSALLAEGTVLLAGLALLCLWVNAGQVERKRA